jgi:hypothetical protein
MKAKRFCIIFATFIGILISSAYIAQSTTKSPAYQVSINFVPSMGWEIKSDSGITKTEYVKIYIPKNIENSSAQTITVSFTPNIKTTAKEFTDNLEKKMQSTLCQRTLINILTQTEDAFSLSTGQSMCKYNNQQEKIYKVFNKEDGQYSAIYTITRRDKNTNEMAINVRDAKIIPVK